MVPEENKVLLEHVAAFMEAPGDAAAANILLEFLSGPAKLYVYADRKAADREGVPLMPLEIPTKKEADPRSARMVLAHAQLAPEDAALEQQGSDLVCRPMPAWQLLQQCMHRGIPGIALNMDQGMVAISMITPGTPLCVLHEKGSYPDEATLAKRVARDGAAAQTTAYGAIAPEGSKVLRERLTAFMEAPDDGEGAAILRELISGPAHLFVLVKGRLGAEGEPPITPADLSLATLEDGRPIRFITATTQLNPESIAPSYEAKGLFFRQLPAWQLIKFCLHQGIVGIRLDPFLPTGVIIGPFGADKRLCVIHKEKFSAT